MEKSFDMAARVPARRMAVAILAATFCVPVTAVTVHTWVDEAGVRHYADAPPSAPEADSIAIELADTSTPADVREDYYSIVNQWQRLREERAASDALALERARLRAAAQADAAREVVVYATAPRHYGAYPLYLPYAAVQRHGHHGHHRHHPHEGNRDGRRGDVAQRRSSVVHATPPEWPRQRYFRR